MQREGEEGEEKETSKYHFSVFILVAHFQLRILACAFLICCFHCRDKAKSDNGNTFIKGQMSIHIKVVVW